MLLHIVQGGLFKDLGSHILILDALVGQDGWGQIVLQVHLLKAAVV